MSDTQQNQPETNNPNPNPSVKPMQTKILYLFTRTPLHVGAGASVGAIDQPIIRERHTGFPVIPGSSIKGVLRDAMSRKEQQDADRVFGKQDAAGAIAIGEAKILAFPVRSAKGSFAFITCPLALERLRRAINNSGEQSSAVPNSGEQSFKVPSEPDDMTCLAGKAVTLERNNAKGVVLEEYKFNVKGDFPQNCEDYLLDLLEDAVWKVAKGRLVLLSNGDFAHFVRNACEVSQHVAIKPDTGTARPGALFNLEAVPAETLFFAPLTPLMRCNEEWKLLEALINNNPILQFGGDSTTGLGFCSVKLA
ncbi:type III-B CRISPR module RAMP protein Cmr4 [Fontisphaera persica]|uniref:type III-B CRISPR module RAMP protein Cmr4 n=1 Tax=Fontisphaera persica TaxID=2974023 RepID=UPI0024BF9FDA|nr:type III-B CRISPR module RAMP protein Cmr4 [Fontisphaera persica]WCJ60672.1 type III-B CRISPR module RAMP protein Cmr4 [Fontisphaera persica]